MEFKHVFQILVMLVMLVISQHVKYEECVHLKLPKYGDDFAQYELDFKLADNDESSTCIHFEGCFGETRLYISKKCFIYPIVVTCDGVVRYVATGEGSTTCSV